MRRSFIILTMLILITTACSNIGESTPEVEPTLAPPPATMRMLFTVVEPLPEDEDLTGQLERLIFEETGLSVDVIATGQSDAIAAICNNQGELPAISWLDGLQLGFSQAEDCGKPQLMISRSPERTDELIDVSIDEEAREAFEQAQSMMVAMEVDETVEGEADDDATAEATLQPTEEPTAEPEPTETPVADEEGTADEAGTSDDATATSEEDATDDQTESTDTGPTTADTGLILINPALETDTLDVITEAVYCRLGYEDDYSWLLPTLILQQNGFDIRSASQIVDYPDVPLMVEAVASGDCTMTGVSARAFAQLEQELQDSVTLAAIDVPEIPYGVLVYSPEIELGVRLALNRVFTQFAENANSLTLLDTLLGVDELISVDDDDFTTLAEFIRSTGVGFDGLGN